jgi:HSP20 family protein
VIEVSDTGLREGDHMATPVRRQPMLPDLTEWFESFPALLHWRSMPELHPLRLEEYVEDGKYVIRAELPGIDPEKDVEITVGEGILTIGAERSEEKVEKNRSEFRYGSFRRAVRLPMGAKEDEITAAYRNGILTVTVALGEEKQSSRRIAVKHES